MTKHTMATVAFALVASARAGAEPSAITVDKAIELALQHDHALLATRTTIEQSRADEITANLRPNPGLFADWQSLPLGRPSQGGYFDGTQVDVGVSYTFERGDKRDRRVEAARGATAVIRSQVADAERALAFRVASRFIDVELAESTLELARTNLDSFRKAVDIADERLKSGGTSENDYLKIKLQLLQFETDVEQAQLARIQALADLRQLVGRDALAADFDIASAFEYRPVKVDLDALEKLALEHRADLRAARQGVTAAESQHALAEANSSQDVTLSASYSRSAGLNAATIGLSIPLAIFDRNQGERRKTTVAVTQATEQAAEVTGQVKTDIADAYEALERADRVVQHYRSGYLDISQKSRDISEYAYKRGGLSLFDFLDAERTYRATQLGYRQALADYLVAVEQVRQSVGTRALP
jgi:cobalt-zinc-cadmium efflux system outer membrane protein